MQKFEKPDFEVKSIIPVDTLNGSGIDIPDIGDWA